MRSILPSLLVLLVSLAAISPADAQTQQRVQLCYVFRGSHGTLGRVAIAQRLHLAFTNAAQTLSNVSVKRRSWYNALDYDVDELLASITSRNCSLIYFADRETLFRAAASSTSVPSSSSSTSSTSSAGSPMNPANLTRLAAEQSRTIVAFGFPVTDSEVAPLTRFTTLLPYCNDELLLAGHLHGARLAHSTASRQSSDCIAFLTYDSRVRRDEAVAFSAGVIAAFPAAVVKVIEVDAEDVRCGANANARRILSSGCSTFAYNVADDRILTTFNNVASTTVDFGLVDYSSGASADMIGDLVIHHTVFINTTSVAAELMRYVTGRQQPSSSPLTALPKIMFMRCALLNGPIPHSDIADTDVSLARQINTTAAPADAVPPWCAPVAPDVIRCTAGELVVTHEPLYSFPLGVEQTRVSLSSGCRSGYVLEGLGEATRCVACPIGTFSSAAGEPCQPCDAEVGPGATYCPSTKASSSVIIISVIAALVASVLIAVIVYQRVRGAASRTGGAASGRSGGGLAGMSVGITDGTSFTSLDGAALTAAFGGAAGVLSGAAAAAAALKHAENLQAVRAHIADMIEKGQFQLGGLIGKGAGASVFSAVLHNGRTIAMKQIPLSSTQAARRRARARRELQMMLGVSSPYCVQYFGMRCSASAAQIFMEFVPGGTLKSFVTHLDGPLHEPVARRFTAHLVRGVLALHDAGILHRDLKGDNCLISPDGVLKVCDFGAAILEGEAQEPHAAGTPIYMAPCLAKRQLQMDGGGDFSRASDVWALGLCVAEMCQGGELPLKRCVTANEAFKYIASSKFRLTFAPDAHPEMMAFVQRCCHPDPEKRPTCAELLDDPWIAEHHS